MKNMKLFLVVLVFAVTNAFAQNPIIRDQFTADPSARVFGDTVYLYASHDILAVEGRGRVGWFCMEDYHVFSSSNLTDWTDHGVIVSQNNVPWVRANSYALWAPDCIAKNGKYYFYFPAPAKDTAYGRGFSIGVAVSDKPYGPFIPEPAPIKGVHGIDPAVFFDTAGQPYLCWSARNFYVAKLKENMLELASEPVAIQGLPEKGLKEGPSIFERKGIYYLVYPHVENTTERIEYAISPDPTGPYKFAGVLMDEAPNGCWTNQASVIHFKGQWYLFYHQNDYSPNFDKNRSVRIDSLSFNDDGTIRKVIPTLRGVGVTNALEKIQIDRYSAVSGAGVSTDYLDTLNRFEGWKAKLDSNAAWIQYNGVDFGSKKFSTVNVRAASNTGGVLEIRLNKPESPIIAQIKVSQGSAWKIIRATVTGLRPGIQNLVVSLKGSKPVEVDWIQFIK